MALDWNGMTVPEPNLISEGRAKRTIGFMSQPLSHIDIVRAVPYEEAKAYKKAFGLDKEAKS